MEKTVDINMPVSVAYAQCLRFSDYPRFMEGVQEVRVADERHLQWRVGEARRTEEGSRAITGREHEKSLAWRDRDGPECVVMLSFACVGQEKSRIKRVVEQAEHANADLKSCSAFASGQRIAGNLERLKKLLENEGRDWTEYPSRPSPRTGDTSRFVPLDGGSSAAADSGSAKGQRDDAARAARPARPRHQSVVTEGLSTVKGLLQGRYQPLSMVRKMSGEIDLLFERLVGRPMAQKWAYGTPGKWLRTVEVVQRWQELVVAVDLPGVDKQDVHLEISEGKLSIEGERREPG